MKTRLVTLLLVLGAAASASALTREEILVELNNCNARCDSEATACTSQCCGILFCRKGCIGGCSSTEEACKESCSLSVIGGTSDGAFFDAATLARGGRGLAVGGPLFCPEGATADIDVTVTQATSGALGTGHARVACPGDAFAVAVRAAASTVFEPAATAQACGTAWIHAAEQSFDAFQWCREITILPEGVLLEE